MKKITSLHLDDEIKDKAKAILRKKGYSLSLFVNEKLKELIIQDETEPL
jgi:antitoxin component of RelBE/YafQ-DinJ toxin-antitoxin module